MFDLNREGVSGLRTFEGEDLCAGDRRRKQQLQMQSWTEQQLKEKAALKAQEDYKQSQFESQEAQIHELLTKSEEEHHAKRTAMTKAMMEENLLLAKQKKDTDARDRAI